MSGHLVLDVFERGDCIGVQSTSDAFGLSFQSPAIRVQRMVARNNAVESCLSYGVALSGNHNICEVLQPERTGLCGSDKIDGQSRRHRCNRQRSQCFDLHLKRPGREPNLYASSGVVAGGYSINGGAQRFCEDPDRVGCGLDERAFTPPLVLKRRAPRAERPCSSNHCGNYRQGGPVEQRGQVRPPVPPRLEPIPQFQSLTLPHFPVQLASAPLKE